MLGALRGHLCDSTAFLSVRLYEIKTGALHEAQYTPPTPTPLSCRVESRRRRVGGVNTIRN